MDVFEDLDRLEIHNEFKKTRPEPPVYVDRRAKRLPPSSLRVPNPSFFIPAFLLS
jgi:hypothetical protein